jgi:RHH-type proline utilization regulon transcriptional repressor/proline dehydrogenase/delta 1-pyrroline-5-carboxylate dehydrogenase
MTDARGDYIGGAFHPPQGEPFESRDPARDDAVVLRTGGDPARVAQATAAAAEAAPGWASLSMDERAAHLHRFRAALAAREDGLSEAITREMGKLRSEARVEVKALVNRFGLVEEQLRHDLRGGALPGFPNERIRHAPHGVVGVIGPYNFPLHLCHAHVVPALLTGNTVVVKPSEVTPLAGQRYAEAADAAGLPPGVLGVVQGGGAVGAALVADPRVRGLTFTGSWPTGRRIAEAALDRPELLLALEMGGKNMCVVRKDADLRQAAHEVLVGAYLTTGQRCTCTDRVLVHRSRVDAFQAAVLKVLLELKFGDPEDPESFAGPLAATRFRDGFLAALETGRRGGAQVVLEGGPREGGAFLGPSVHRLPDGVHTIEGYTDEELFGPDLCIETFEDDDEAIAALNGTGYGFAHAVFTHEDAAFARYQARVESGILNRNRGTNLASPRLPFGGVKRSGNFRPAGAHAPRNMVYPVATLVNPGTSINANQKVAAHLPDADLDALEAKHGGEEACEALDSLLTRPRPLKVTAPEGGAVPRSTALSERFYAGGRYAREKKPPVVDHLRTEGPYLVSVDDVPLSVLDGMSQTATLPLGFAPAPVVKGYVEGAFGDALVRSASTDLGGSAAAEDFAALLRQKVPGLPTVSFASSGAEANEKAFVLCHQAARPGQDRVLAFEGAFHGRTLLALYTSHNPAKREPFEIAGYEATFVGYPLHEDPMAGEPDTPEGFLELAGAGDVDGLTERFGASDDALLAREVAVLAEVGRELARGTYFAVDIEPMQSEGGDRYATARFHRALRLLTRAHGVSLIMDEVQTGFGLGGSFLWHQGFGLVDARGEPDHPDAVVFAKRAQLGVVMSRFDDPEPGFAFPASLIRGRLHAEALGLGEEACRVEGLVRPHLEVLARRWDHLVAHPRTRGFALAFDLPTPADLLRYVGQRFWRGAVVFGAGSRTVRYRLNASFGAAEVDRLFEAVHRSLAWLEAHPGQSPPAWEAPPKQAPPERVDFTVRLAAPGEADALVPRIAALEAEVYEAARRDPPEKLARAFADGGVAVVAEAQVDGETRVVGSALACPASAVDVAGPEDDPLRAHSLYSLAITVHPDFQGRGLGRALKRAQLEGARSAGRYRHVVGRNRVPDAEPMARLNRAFGAYEVARLEGQYEGAGVASYYRQPVDGRFRVDPAMEAPLGVFEGDLAQGLTRPFATPPASLLEAYRSGALYGPAVTKLTVLNYLTPAVVRATEWVAALTPESAGSFLCSGRDEAVDKGLRALLWHRPEGEVALSLEGAYVGHTVASARSLSDPGTHRGGEPYFDWPLLPHPAEQSGFAWGVRARAAVEAAGGPDRVLGIVVEPIQERTGRVLDAPAVEALERFRAETGIPILTVETAGAYYRAGHGGPFASAPGFVPDVRTWWTGGHLGMVHVTAPYAIAKPMTLVSTWDGDELSLIQMHHQLRAARSIDVEAASRLFDDVLAIAAEAGIAVRGRGLYRVLDAGERAASLAHGLAQAGVRVRPFPGGRLAVIPPLDRAEAAASRLAEGLRTALGRGS